MIVTVHAPLGDSTVSYREHRGSSTPDSSTITVKDFLEFSSYLSRNTTSLEGLRDRIDHCKRSRVDASPEVFTDPTRQARVWRAVQDRIPSLITTDPSRVELSDSLFNAVFQPVIPDSKLVKIVAQTDRHFLVKCAARIGLVCEMFFREIACAALSLATRIFSLFKPDEAALLQLRLDSNRHIPRNILIRDFFRLIGGY